MKIADADLKGKGVNMTFEVTAIAPTLGWTNVALSKVEYVNPPIDGVQDYILNCTPPSGVAATAIELFTLSVPVEPTDWLQGVRVRDVNNKTLMTLRNPVKNVAAIGSDSLWINSCGMRNDKLIIEATYGGGQHQQHSFQLCWDGEIKESNPVQVRLELTHNCNKDAGRALLPTMLQFDLSTLEGFPNQEMEIHLVCQNTEKVLQYCPTSCKPDQVILENRFRKTENAVLA